MDCYLLGHTKGGVRVLDCHVAESCCACEVREDSKRGENLVQWREDGKVGLADKKGRLEDRPLRIKAEVFPYRDLDVNRELTVLERLGFIQRYEVPPNGDSGQKIKVIQVLNFSKHQHPHHTEKESELPAPVSSRLNNGETPSDSLIPDSLIPDKNSLSEPSPSSDEETAPARNKPSKQPSREACRLAQLLKTEILRNKPDYRITAAQERKWGFTAARMIGLDGRDPEAIANLIRWAQRDEFWMTNILSMGKLREKFDALELKMKGSRQQATPVKPVSAVEQHRKLLEGAIQ